MNAKKESGRTIHISQLVFSYLRQWRVVVAAMLVGAVLLGALQLIAPMRMASGNQEKINSNEEKIQSYYDSIGSHDEDAVLKDYDERIKNENLTLERQKKVLSNYENTLTEVEALSEDLSGSSQMDALSTKTKLLEDINELQNTVGQCEANIDYYQKERKSAEKQFSAIKKLKAENKELKEEMEPRMGAASIKRLLSFAVLGACIGAFLAACAVLVKYLFRKTLDAASSVSERWDIPVIADMRTQPQTKHDTKLDRRIAAWSGEAEQRDTDTDYELLAAKLQAICTEDQILLCGSIPAAEIEQLAQRLRSFMPNGRTVCAVGSPAEEANAAVSLKGKQAVMVEKRNHSLYANINALIKQAELEQTDIVGCIVL